MDGTHAFQQEAFTVSPLLSAHQPPIPLQGGPDSCPLSKSEVVSVAVYEGPCIRHVLRLHVADSRSEVLSTIPWTPRSLSQSNTVGLEGATRMA